MHNVHYTIDESAKGIARHAPPSGTDNAGSANRVHVFVPGHSLGDGWTRHIVQLDEGDTADAYGTTKRCLYGPGFVVYDCHRTGITVREFDGPQDFYNGLRSTELLRTAIDSGQLRGTLVGKEIADFLTNSGVEMDMAGKV